MRQNFLLILNIFAILLLKNLVKSDVNNNTIIKVNSNNKTVNAFANTTNIAITNFQTKLTNGADLSKVQLQEVKAAVAEKLLIGRTANNNTEKLSRRKITSTSNVNATFTTSTTSTAERKNENANTSNTKLPQKNDKILENSTNANNKTAKDQQQTFFFTENGPLSIPKTTATATATTTTTTTNDIVNKTKLNINDKSKSNNTNNNAQLTISTQSINATNSILNKTTTAAVATTTTTTAAAKTNNSASTTILTKSTSTKMNTDFIANKTKNITVITTEKPKPKKPVITYGVEDFPELDRNITNNIKNTKDTTNKVQLEEPQTEAIREPPIVEPSQEYNGHDYIVPIATIILIVPLAIGTLIVAYRRLRDLWATRHYRRMDFLVDGMYND